MHILLKLLPLLSLLGLLSHSGYGQEIIISGLDDYVLCQGESIDLNPSVSGGDGNYTYNWSPADHLSASNVLDPIFTAEEAGSFSYTLTVNDGSGESTTANTTITVSALPTIEADVSDSGCNINASGLIAIRNPNPSNQYIWSTGQTNTVLQGLPPGEYCVTVVNALGCATAECFIIGGISTDLALSVSGADGPICEPVDALVATVTGGAPPYTYSYFLNNTSIATTAILDNPIDGVYSVWVTDANGCTAIQRVEVNSAPLADIQGIPVLDCATGTTTLTVGASTADDEFTHLWTAPNGNEVEGDAILADQTGLYRLRVFNPEIESCFDTTSILVRAFDNGSDDWIIQRIDDCNNITLSGIIPPNYFGPISFTWTLPDGSTSSEIAIAATQTGVYTLETDIGGLDCVSTNTTFISLEAEVCGRIEGYLRLDESDDCLPDAGELGVPNVVLTATGSNGETYHSITDAAGYYFFDIPNDNYTLTHELPSSNWSACQDEYPLSLATGQTIQQDIALQAEAVCPELQVEISAQFLRRCFQNNYWVEVCNIGTDTAFQPQVNIVLDDFLVYEHASISPLSVEGQSLTFELPNMVPGACELFNIRFTVSCDAELGQTHCTTAAATPDPLCALGYQNWSGASLEASGVCIGDEVVFTITNAGNGPLSEAVSYIVIEDGIAMAQPNELTDLVIDGTTEIRFPANGTTYMLILDQVEGHPYSHSVTAAVEGCGGTSANQGVITQFSQNTATPNQAEFCLENIGSYDPNDKAALPTGYGPQHYIEPKTELNYRIRFQNTGTDTAFTVVVRDTLSNLLDVRTLKMGASSHNYEAQLSEGNILTVRFDNILLPDSTTNEPASNGFFTYRIHPLADAPLEEVIDNRAAIYFDFNEPIITNTVSHTLGRNFIVTRWREAASYSFEWKAYPNPVREQLNLRLRGEVPDNLRSILLYDATGRPVLQQAWRGLHNMVDMNALPAGWYQLSLRNAQGQVLPLGSVVKE